MTSLSKIAIASMLATTVTFADIYNITVTNNTNPGTFTLGSNNLIDTIENFDEDELTAKLPSYSSSDNISAVLDMRGLEVNLTAVGNTLTFTVPTLGITETFNGTSRDDSVDKLEDWFKENGEATVEKIMKELAKVSPVDPIAGNSNSIMSQSVDNDFVNGFLNVVSKQSKTNMQTTKNGNLVSLSPSITSLDLNGKKSNAYSLPILYSVVSNEDIDRKLNISIPLSYVDIDGAESYNLGIGISYNYPINDSWTLTPAVNYNIVGSVDLATVAQIGNVSLTSSYTYTLPNRHRISLGNMIGYYTTLKLYDGDYAYDAGISNTVLKNGLMYSMDMNSVSKNSSLDIYYVNTKYTGTDLYSDTYNEVGLSYGYNKIEKGSDNKVYKDGVKTSFSYLKSNNDEDGVKLNMNFTF